MIIFMNILTKIIPQDWPTFNKLVKTCSIMVAFHYKIVCWSELIFCFKKGKIFISYIFISAHWRYLKNQYKIFPTQTLCKSILIVLTYFSVCKEGKRMTFVIHKYILSAYSIAIFDKALFIIKNLRSNMLVTITCSKNIKFLVIEYTLLKMVKV